jgi:hypothetical protein
MGDRNIVGLNGQYSWTRRPVWFWQVNTLKEQGWYRDHTSNPIRPIMIYRHTNEMPASASDWYDSDEVAHGMVGTATGMSMVMMNEANAVLRNCRLGRIKVNT